MAAATLAVAVAGCGEADDRAQVRGVVERYTAALRAGDGAGACAELSGAARDELAAQTGRSCRASITRLDLPDAPVATVEVAVTNAKVDLARGGSVFLDRAAEGWRLSAVGCAASGKPADRPFDCALEA